MYDKCYFCLDQHPKLKKESTASFFVNFGRNRGTKEPAYITVPGSDSEEEGRDGDCGRKVKPEKGRANEITKKLEKDFLC